MPVYNQLIAEITYQLQHDILHFEWLLQIARAQYPDLSENECITAVFDSVIALHDKGRIVIGNAHIKNNLVLIEPWPETGRDLLSKMASTITDSSLNNHAFSFWIQLKEHFLK